MQEPLVPDRPLGISEMLTATYRYMRANPSATLGVGALLSVVTAVVNGIVVQGMIFGGDQGSALTRMLTGDTLTAADAQAVAREVASVAPLLGLSSIIELLVQFAAMGVMTLGIVHALRGEIVPPGILWRAVPWKRLLGVNALIVLLIFVSAAPLILIGLFIGGPIGFALAFASIATAFSVIVGTAMAIPASIMHALPARVAITRSLTLVRGAWWRTGAALSAAALVWGSVGSVIGNVIGSAVGALGGGSTFGAVLTTLVAGIVSGAVTLPAFAAMTTLVYVDRLRRTGEAV